MKQFAVIIRLDSNIERVVVEADRFLTRDGELVFEEWSRRFTNLTPVAAFAPGYWLSVSEVV